VSFIRHWLQPIFWLLALVVAAGGFYAPIPVHWAVAITAPVYLLLIFLAAGMANQTNAVQARWNSARALLLAEFLLTKLMRIGLLLLPAWFLFKAGRPLAGTLTGATAILILLMLGMNQRWLSTLAYFASDSRRVNALRRELAAVHALAPRKLGVFSADSLHSALLLMMLALPFAVVFMPTVVNPPVMPWFGYCALLAPAAALLLFNPELASNRLQDAEHADWLNPNRHAERSAKSEAGLSQHEQQLQDDQAEAYAQMLAWNERSLAQVRNLRANNEDLEQTLDESLPPLTELVAKTQQLELFSAILQNNLTQVEALLKAGANANQALSDQHRERRSPLLLAASLGQARIARALLQAGADVNLPCGGQTALIAATRDSWSGRFDVVMTLLTNGADVHALDIGGNSALHHAARSRDGALIQQLLEAGANRSVDNALGLSPLACAAAAGNKLGISSLINYRAQASDKAALGWNSATPPLVAMGDSPHDDAELVKLLLAYSAVNAVDALGRSALHAYAGHDLLDMGAVLLSAGANANLQDQQGCTPLMLAASAGSLRFLQLLANTGASISLLDVRRQSALHYLCSADAPNLAAARVLIAMLTPAMNFDGIRRNAAELALLRGWWDLARLLNPEQALPGALEAALEPHGERVPDRIELLEEAAKFNRLSVAKVMLKLGPAPQSVLTACIVNLGDNFDQDWLQTLRLGGLLLGEKEREPLLTLLARQQPLPVNALQLLLSQGASLSADSELDSLLTLLSGAAHDYAGLRAPQSAPPAALLDQVLIRASAAMLLHMDASRRHALSWACEFADAAHIQRLLSAMASLLSAQQSGALLNSHDADGQTTLLLLLRRVDLPAQERLALAQALIQAGADPNFIGQDGQSPRALALAFTELEPSLVALLSWPPQSHPKRRLLPDDLPAAAQRGDHVAVRRLLVSGLPIDAIDAIGCTALSHAAGLGHPDLLKFLLAQGANPNAGQSPALHCALRAHAACAADPAQDANANTYLRVCERLFEAGADLSLAQNGVDALGLACAMLDIAAVKCLLHFDSSCARRQPPAPIPAPHAIIHAVLALRHEQLNEPLLARIEPLFELLLSADADMNACDAQGRTALLLAVGSGSDAPPGGGLEFQVGWIKLLIKLGCNTQAIDQQGRTALHWCCRHRMLVVANVLLDAGADSCVLDYGRKLPLDLANAVNRHDFAALFRGVPLHGGASSITQNHEDDDFAG